MTENLRKQFLEAFSLEPLPVQFFWTRAARPLDGDIPSELNRRIKGRPWTDVSLQDWRMIGCSPSISRHYLEPATFMYYVPSLVFGSLEQIEFIDFVLEGVMPSNKEHISRESGGWNFTELSRQASGNVSPHFLHYSGQQAGTRLVHRTSIY